MKEMKISYHSCNVVQIYVIPIYLYSLHNMSKSNPYPKGQKIGCLRRPYLQVFNKMPWNIFLYFWNRIKTCLHERDENQLLQLQCCMNLHSSLGWWEQNCSKQVFRPFCMCSRPVLFCNINIICHKISTQNWKEI